MTLTEKFASLTPEQREKFAAVKDAATLDAFASEYGIELTSEEKLVVLEYFKTGTLPLADDDLEMVAGGAAKNYAGICPRCGGIKTYMSNEYQRNKCIDCGYEWR